MKERKKRQKLIEKRLEEKTEKAKRKKEKNRRNKHLIKDVKSVDQNRSKKTIR